MTLWRPTKHRAALQRRFGWEGKETQNFSGIDTDHSDKARSVVAWTVALGTNRSPKMPPSLPCDITLNALQTQDLSGQLSYSQPNYVIIVYGQYMKLMGSQLRKRLVSNPQAQRRYETEWTLAVYVDHKLNWFLPLLLLLKYNATNKILKKSLKNQTTFALKLSCNKERINYKWKADYYEDDDRLIRSCSVEVCERYGGIWKIYYTWSR